MPTKKKNTKRPRPPKKKVIKQKAAAKKTPKKKAVKKKQTKETVVNELLAVGRQAKYKIYQTFLTRISKGESLKPIELKEFRALESELEKEAAGNGGGPDLIRSFDEAAAYCGVSKRTISYHVSRGNITQNADGTFDKKVLDKYLESRGRKKPGPKTGSGDDETGGEGQGEDEKPLSAQVTEADLRWRNARAEREEMLIAQLKKELISRDDVDRETAARIAAVTSGLEAFAERLPGLLVGKKRKEITEIIRGEVWALRDAFSKRGEYI